MQSNFISVNLLDEFKDLKDIKALEEILKKEKWELVKSIDEYSEEIGYQLYFGKGIQVDNYYEYGFPHLLNRKDTYKELERLINYRMRRFMNKLEDFKIIKKFCNSFKSFNINDYLYYVGITSVKEDISTDELDTLLYLCDKFCGDYTDPIVASSALAYELFEVNNITLDELKKLSTDDFYEWYDNGRTCGRALEKSDEPYMVKIGFDCPECKKDGSIIIGEGSVYYYDTEEEYDSGDESSVVDFRFKYNINQHEVFDVECEDEDSKYRVESNEDDFIDNIISNLLPELNKEDIEMER